MAEHSVNLGHCFNIKDTSILATKSGRTEHTIMEVTENELQPNNINSEESFSS